MKKLYIRTFGCQMNERDSEYIAGLFLEHGYELADCHRKADVVLFNTCSVRQHAEHRAVQNIAGLMHKHKNKIYGIVGCSAQALGEKLFKKLPKLDIVCGTGEITRLPELVEKAAKEKILATKNISAPLPELKSDYRKDKHHAHVSIMRGCNNFCSYCIVPHVRGRERSRQVEDIVNEVKGLVARGISEVTLLGQNVNSYVGARHAVPLHTNFVELLKRVNGIKGIEKIRFMTSHPKDVSPELFKALGKLDKVAKHLHLPLQSGSDRILKLMKRGYTRERYTDLIKKAREAVPGLRLTTDIITGFPTETEKDFGDTLNLMKEIKFNSAYIFKYSPRPGTEAAEMADDVPEEVKKGRHAVLLKLIRKTAFFIMASLIMFTSPAKARDAQKSEFIKGINVSFLRGNYEKVIEDAEKNLHRQRLAGKKRKEVLYLLGLSYMKTDRFDEARETFDSILEMRGEGFTERAHMGIADSYFCEKRFGDAINVYENILDIYPEGDGTSGIYYNLGLCYKRQSKPDKADFYFRKIKEEYSKSFEADKLGYLPAAEGAPYYIVQLGAFKSLKNAKKLVKKLTRKKYDSYIQKIRGKKGGVLYRVRAGKFSNKSYAMRLSRKLRRDRFSVKVIVE